MHSFLRKLFDAMTPDCERALSHLFPFHEAITVSLGWLIFQPSLSVYFNVTD